MAGADSTIRVNIIGDASKLRSELGKADKALGGWGGTLAKVAAAGAALEIGRQIADFASDSLAEFDRLGDATDRLGMQLGDLADPLVSAAEGFADLGLSAQDVLELEATFADTATAAGVADDAIAAMADDAAATAAALSLIRDEDPATLLDLIAKAGAGSAKAMRTLGVDVSDAEVEARALRDTGKETAAALTDGELAAARYALVLEDLKPALDAARDGSSDLEQKQRELEARFETLQAKIGGAIEGPLNDLLGWILSGIQGWELFIAKMDDVAAQIDELLGPVGDAIDAIAELAGLLNVFSIPGRVQDALDAITGHVTGGGSPSTGRVGSTRTSSGPVTVVTSADPEAVARAVDTYSPRIGGR